jgi:hypothetical protein
MTPDEINIAIAEWRGVWVYQEPIRDVRVVILGDPRNPGDSPPAYTSGQPILSLELKDASEVPNYYGSLDAIHEAAKRVPKRKEYAHMLYRVVNSLATDAYVHWSDIGEDIFDATAPQRCEALLKTIERWRD